MICLLSTVHLTILLIFGCQLYGKKLTSSTLRPEKYIISIHVRAKGVNYRKFDPTENYKNDFHSFADRPMMTVVTVETSHINKVVHDMIKFTFILWVLDRQTLTFLRCLFCFHGLPVNHLKKILLVY